MKKIVGSYPSSYTAPQVVYMAKVGEMLLRWRAEPCLQFPMTFYLFKICLIFSEHL